jgi:hypothetical protein
LTTVACINRTQIHQRSGDAVGASEAAVLIGGFGRWESEQSAHDTRPQEQRTEGRGQWAEVGQQRIKSKSKRKITKRSKSKSQITNRNVSSPVLLVLRILLLLLLLFCLPPSLHGSESTMVTGTSRAPIHRMAWAGIVAAVLAGVLALYGAMHAEKHLPGSPLRQARGSAGLPAQPGPWYEKLWVKGEVSIFGDRIDRKMLALAERSKFANYSLQVVAFVLPFFLGSAGALLGGWAMKTVQAAGGRYSGNTLAVFSMMIGGLAAVVAGCMMVSLYVWPHLPTLYTT